jgi:ATP-binding cassette subfamily B protein
MIITSISEVVSLGAVLPFLSVLTSPERVFEHTLAQPIIQALDLSEPQQLLLPLTIAFSVAAMFSGIMRLTLLWAQTRLSHAVGADLSINIYRRTLYQPYAVHVERNSSEIIAAISKKSTEVVGGALLPTFMILSTSLMVFAIIFTLFAIEPTVALSAFMGFSAIYVVIIKGTKKRLEKNSQRISLEQNQVIKALQEGLGGIRDVLIDGAQEAYCKVYRSADLPLRHAQADIAIISGSPRFIVESLGMILIAMLAFFIVEKEGNFSDTIPIIGALALGAQRLLPLLQQFYANWSAIRGNQASLKDTLDLLDQPIPDHLDRPFPEPIPFQHSIKLNKLAFRYTTQTPWVLKGLDLTIPRGSRVGFIGTTGSGKSTLFDIMMGLLQQTKGSMFIDDQPITKKNHRAWQAHIAHVPQVIFLSDATIGENIAFGVPLELIDFDRVREAAKKAKISQTVESWAEQYSTKVGERGVRLSGGQRQRIGIARALYKQADVIVLDEATSALDNDTEGAVMEAINNIDEGITVLIVAHRLSTLKGCSQIVELSNGVIKRTGTYKEIIG